MPNVAYITNQLEMPPYYISLGKSHCNSNGFYFYNKIDLVTFIKKMKFRSILVGLCILVSILVGCKKDNKIEKPSTDASDLSTQRVQKLYVFSSQNTDLPKLYTSDIWQIVKADVKKLGGTQITLYKKDSLFAMHYILEDVTDSMFNSKMEALPSFKNFREMSLAITKDTLDYGAELKPALHQGTVNSLRCKEPILYLMDSTGIRNVSILNSLLAQNKILSSRLKDQKIQPFEILYNEKYMVCRFCDTYDTDMYKELRKLKWSDLLELKQFKEVKEDYSQIVRDNPIFTFKSSLKFEVLE